MASSRLLLLALFQTFLIGFCLIAGYLIVGWWSGTRDAAPLVQICAQVDYVDRLQKDLEGQKPQSKEVREEFKALVEQCRAALRDRTEEND
jgi:hypothetical protein